MDRADKLDTKELRNLLQLVVAWDPRKPKDGQLAIYNSLRIAVPGAVEQEVRVVCQHVMFTVPRARLTGSCCIVDRSCTGTSGGVQLFSWEMQNGLDNVCAAVVS